MTETDVRKQVREYLERCGWYVWPTHLHNGKRNPAARGISDFEAVKDGRFIAVEVKGEKGKLTDDQEAHRAILRAHGVNYYTVRDLDDLKAAVN